jgi:hypothetical protein
MGSLNVVRMIVPPGPSHPARMDVVGHDVAIVRERFAAESAYAVLSNDLLVEEFSHLAVGPEFPIFPGVLRVLDAPNAHLALALFSHNWLPAATGQGAVDRAELVTTQSHSFLLSCLEFGGLDLCLEQRED